MASDLEDYSDITLSDDEKSAPMDVDLLFQSDPEQGSFSGFEREEATQPVEATKSKSSEVSVKQDKPKVSTIKPKSNAVGILKGPGKGPGKNLKGKAPAKRKSNISTEANVKAAKILKPAESGENSQIADILTNFFRTFSPCFSQPSTSTGITHQGQGSVDEENQQPASVDNMALSEIFSNVDTSENQIINTDTSGLEFPKIFEDQTKFSDPISESMAEFVKNACTRKADVAKFMEANLIPSNCKSLVPPLINSEVWSYLYANIQQRDKSLQDVQKVLGLGIVPIIKIAEMLKSNQIDIAKIKTYITQALALSCNAFFEINIKRRYFIRPYVSKKFQQLCSASCPIEEHLFPKDMAKRMKEISEASQINRQIAPLKQGSKNYSANRRPYQRGRGGYYQQAPNRGRGRGRPYRRGYRG